MLSDVQCRSVLGGGGAVWSVYVDTGSLMTMTYPRLAVIAERLWSSRETNNIGRRLADWSCRAEFRNVGPTNPANPRAHSNPTRQGPCRM
eukprot:TRINITY_DN15168_c0_g1_i1.p2 TRINITY_DN15168_c0_g1~~TRINITY_DN15168_c0_g1_i1.p2  ORF type:complete len:100 (-),score=9.44 TRINITY_DN15168_c0_g1_i1:329-598(-)